MAMCNEWHVYMTHGRQWITNYFSKNLNIHYIQYTLRRDFDLYLIVYVQILWLQL